MAFIKGQSGNPRGRTKGKTPATKIRAAITKDMPEIIEAMIESAKNGDATAAKLLLDRVCPTLKPQAVPISLPVMESLTDNANTIMAATLSGQVPPDIGAQLITALANQSKIIEIDELIKRIDALEQKQ